MTSEMQLETTELETMLGRLTLAASETALVGVYFPDHRPAPRVRGAVVGAAACSPAARRLLTHASEEILEYLAGTRSVFTVPIALRGTELQRAVWAALLAIPRGETRTYGELAKAVGKPNAPRAVAQQVARNPVSILVPCHRALGVGRRLTGFAGGVERKARLLAIENAAFAPS